MKRQINTQVKISHSNILIPQEKKYYFWFWNWFYVELWSLLNVAFRKVLSNRIDGLEFLILSSVLTGDTKYCFKLLQHNLIFLMILIVM